MPSGSDRVPSYRLHKPSGKAVVTLNGHDHYLGIHDSPESRAEYRRLIGEYCATRRAIDGMGPYPDISVNELMLRFLEWAEGYYRKNGQVTKEVETIKGALKPLKLLYGLTQASRFGPVALKAARERYIGAGLCRNECNRRARIVVRMFKWAVGEQLVHPSVHLAIKAVQGLAKDRSGARESGPVEPVAEGDVMAALPHLSAPVAALVRFMLHTGCRPGEATRLRPMDLDRTGEVWVYIPPSHKEEHHDKSRAICVGPQAQAAILPLLEGRDPAACVFSPREAWQANQEALAARRIHPKRGKPKKAGRPSKKRRVPGARYTPTSINQAIGRACDRAGIARWHSNQLRHAAATRINALFGLDAVRAVHGHSDPKTSARYAARDLDQAREVMKRVG